MMEQSRHPIDVIARQTGATACVGRSCARSGNLTMFAGTSASEPSPQVWNRAIAD